MNIVFRIKKYLAYLVAAQTKYYLHSPFVYQFYLHVLEGEKPGTLTAIELLREQLKKDKTPVAIADYGTGTQPTRTVATIAGRVTINPKYGLLLYRLVSYFKPAHVLELGTSVGLSSSYMAVAGNGVKVTTLEGAPSVADIARRNHQQLQLNNVEVITGRFDEILLPVLAKMPTVDLVFFDGNHTEEATLAYFETCMQYVNEHSIFVFDDIYWSPGMHNAWQKIKSDPRVRLTLDVYQFGICFFNKEKLAKEDFVLLY
jgi:predicted O-methyltransferase YrrM